MSTVRCAVILLASTPGAAGLLHAGQPAGPAEGGLEFAGTSMPHPDFPGDGLEATVPPFITFFSDVELAANGLIGPVADTVCRSYERPPHYHPQFQRQGEGAGVDPNATDDLSGSATLNDTQGSSGSAEEVKAACIGSSWDGQRCRLAVNAIRNSTWPRLVAATHGDSTFRHLRSLAEVPPVKQFSQGGGVAGDVPCRPGGGNAHLYYRHIFKDGGKAIERNLALLSGRPPRQSFDENWWYNNICEEFQAAQRDTTPRPVLFTFVREPMAKFIDGYREIASRGLIDIIRGTEVGTVEHAQLFLDNVFHGSCDNGHVLLQIQNMFGPSCESHFDYIGHLENFTSHWHQLGEIAGCTENLEWPRDWKHRSERDRKAGGAEAAMREALALSGGKLARALCVWLLPDYIAFDYPLPKQCKADADLMEIAGSLLPE